MIKAEIYLYADGYPWQVLGFDLNIHAVTVGRLDTDAERCPHFDNIKWENLIITREEMCELRLAWLNDNQEILTYYALRFCK